MKESVQWYVRLTDPKTNSTVDLQPTDNTKEAAVKLSVEVDARILGTTKINVIYLTILED